MREREESGKGGLRGGRERRETEKEKERKIIVADPVLLIGRILQLTLGSPLSVYILYQTTSLLNPKSPTV